MEDCAEDRKRTWPVPASRSVGGGRKSLVGSTGFGSSQMDDFGSKGEAHERKMERKGVCARMKSEP